MVSKVILTGMFCGAVYGLLACSGSDNDGDGGGGGDKYGERRIDTTNFKNSASEGEFKAKGDGVDEYFNDLGEVKNSFLASGAGNSIAAGFKAMMDGDGDFNAEPTADPGECHTDYSQEDTPAGDYLTVETTTCVTEDDDGAKVTCVETVKKNWADQVVSTGKTCESTNTTTNTNTVQSGGAASQYVPSFDQVQDCEEAFGTFEQTYQGVKTEFDNVYGMLMQPDGLSLAGSGLTDAGELEKVENDDKSAVTYQVKAPQQQGLEVSGTISGGANDTTLLIRQKLKVAFDMSQMGMPPQNGDMDQPDMPSMKMAVDTDGTIAVDTTLKLIEQDVDMTMILGDATNAMTSNVKGRIAVSAGADKFVTVKLDMGGQAEGKTIAANLDMETRLVDKNKLTFRANMTGDQAGEMSFELIRTADGECEVQNLKNTMAQAQNTPAG